MGAASLAWQGAALADDDDHDHGGHSDIVLDVVAGKITLLGGGTAADGSRVYEGEFHADDFFTTPNPGFATLEGQTYAGLGETQYQIRGYGSLLFWNGAGWTSDFSTGESLLVVKDLPGANPLDFTLTFTAGGSDITGTGVVGRTFSDGSLHAHVDFALLGGGGLDPTLGAYAIQVQLYNSLLADSDTFYIAFNNGLDHEVFDATLTALPVPEPETYALMGLGLAVVAFAARRRVRRTV
ncbi:MAG: PEP-CTERM sorting domain-containing protein [Burkholderiales bacterium]|nr:PEP-CTERM sorting domain-containing protein [Burkholderiales bacterium]